MRCHADNGKFASRISPRPGDAMTKITAGATSPTAAGAMAAAAAPAAAPAAAAPRADQVRSIFGRISLTCVTRWRPAIALHWFDKTLLCRRAMDDISRSEEHTSELQSHS